MVKKLVTEIFLKNAFIEEDAQMLLHCTVNISDNTFQLFL